MSDVWVVRHARIYVFKQKMDRFSRALLGKVFDAARPANLQYFWEIGSDAGLNKQILTARCVALFFLFAWANLTDDLVDGDGSYVEDPEHYGPILLYLLRSLADQVAFEEGEVTTKAWSALNQRFVVCAALGLEEVQKKPWNQARWLSVARGIAGAQHSAYLRLLWDGTAWASMSEEIGEDVGLLSQYYHDEQSEDPRLCTLSDADRFAVLVQMKERARVLWGRAKEAGIHGLCLLIESMGWEVK